MHTIQGNSVERRGKKTNDRLSASIFTRQQRRIEDVPSFHRIVLAFSVSPSPSFVLRVFLFLFPFLFLSLSHSLPLAVMPRYVIWLCSFLLRWRTCSLNKAIPVEPQQLGWRKISRLYHLAGWLRVKCMTFSES